MEAQVQVHPKGVQKDLFQSTLNTPCIHGDAAQLCASNVVATVWEIGVIVFQALTR